MTMNSTLAAVLNVVGRVMLATIFLMSALGNKIPNFGKTVEYMSAHHVPVPNLSLVGAIVFLILGGFSIVLGFKTRIGASLLAVFLVLATYFFHNFWTLAPDSPEFQSQMIQFLKNLGLLGAMLMLIANGPGPASIDRWFTPAGKANNQNS